MPIFAVHYTYTEATAADRATNRPEHRGWLNALVEVGTVLTSGPYPDGTGALLIFRAADAQALTTLLTEDPFAKLGLIEAVRVVEWQPVMGAFAE
ncbi:MULTISPECIES: YciI family protein [unclassified Nocardia]|uniref:YciI family protein n=1 Tax=unclassified Nocardia TaxID=2637762 RepID=UPI00339EE760